MILFGNRQMEDDSEKFIIESTGSGVSTLRLEVSQTMVVTLDGTARFYTDSGGTTGESTSWTITAGSLRTIYLKCTSGSSNLYITNRLLITKWGKSSTDGWTSATGAAKIYANINRMQNLTQFRITGTSQLYGALPNGLTYLYINGNLINWTYSGALPNGLTYLYINGNLINWTYNTILGTATFTIFNLSNYRIEKMSNADAITLIDSLRTKTGNLPATCTLNDIATPTDAGVVAARNALVAAGKGCTTFNLGL